MSDLVQWEGPGIYYPAMQLRDGTWLWRKAKEKEAPIAGVQVEDQQQAANLLRRRHN